jgi:hypothetical protein
MSNAVIGGASQPVYVTGGEVTTTGTVTVAEPLDVTASTPLDVAVTNATLNVAVTNTPSVTISGTVTIDDTPAINVNVTGTPSVNVDNAQLDAFENQLVAQQIILFASDDSRQSDRQPLRWHEKTSGATNTITYDSNLQGVKLTVAEVGYVIRQSKAYVLYQPGRSQGIQMTAILHEPVAGIETLIGYFDAKNGVGFGVDATSFFVFRRSSTSGSIVTTKYRSADWDDPMNGSGESGVTLDQTKDILYKITFGWQGAGPVKFSIFANGHWVDFFTYWASNVTTVSWMGTAVLPMRAQMTNSGVNTANIKMICWEVSSAGGSFQFPSYAFSAARPLDSGLAVLNTATPYPLVSIRINTSRFPRRTINISGIEALVSGNNPYALYKVFYFPSGVADPLTNESWTAMDTNSAVDYDISATAITLTNGICIASGYIGGSNRASLELEDSIYVPLSLDISGAGDPLTTNTGANSAIISVVATGGVTGGGSCTGFAGITVTEL